jgi:hypothetical protein
MATALFTPTAGAVLPPDAPANTPWLAVVATPTANADMLVNGDVNNTPVGFFEVSFRNLHGFTDTGLAAALNQANTYLAAAKVTAVGAGRSFVDQPAGVEATQSWVLVNHKRCRYPVLAADIAGQVTAWATLLGVGANVS